MAFNNASSLITSAIAIRQSDNADFVSDIFDLVQTGIWAIIGDSSGRNLSSRQNAERI